MKTPILGSSYVARSVNAADNRMVNLFPEITPDNGKEAAFLQRAPGLRLINTIGKGPIRGLWAYGNYGYAVSGNELYQVDNNWNAKYLGVVSGTGPVSMADNGTQLFIAANPTAYIYNNVSGAYSQITDPDFPGAVTVGFLDGYFVFNQPGSQKFWVTGAYDGSSIDPLDFASAAGLSDNIVALLVDHREVWLFGVNSTEVWYDAGLADFPLAPIQGAFNEYGCAATYSVAKLDNRIFWLGADARGRGIVYTAEGYNARRVSTHAVEWHIQQYDDIANAVAYSYQQDGHSFYVLNFPGAKTSWVYDTATEAWHERGAWNQVNAEWYRPRGNNQMFFNNNTVIGDYENGNIYSYDLYIYDYDYQTQRWLRSWRALPSGTNDLKRTTQHSLQLDCESGVGLTGRDPFDPQTDRLTTESGAALITESGDIIVATTYVVQGANPQVMLRWSDDGGHTWSNEHLKSMGRAGEYGRRVIWRRLGMTQKLRDRVYEISGTDPVKIAIVGAQLILDPTNA